MAEELKPCPFCGGEARMVSFLSRRLEKGRMFYVKCPYCDYFLPSNDCEEKVIEAWNRRANNGSKTD